MDAENCSWSIQAVLGTCQVGSSSILSGSKSISFIRKNGNILRGGETMEVKGFFPAYRKNRRLVKYYVKLDIENPIIRINTAFKGCSSLEKISVLPRIYHN